MTDTLKFIDDLLHDINYVIMRQHTHELTSYDTARIQEKVIKFQEKLQEKPMQNNQDINMLDPVRILADARDKTIACGLSWFSGMDETLGTIGVVIRYNLTDIEVSFSNPINKNYYYSINAIERIIQESKQAIEHEAQEIKLEVGQKYSINYEARYLGVFNFISETSFNYIVETDKGTVLVIPKNDLAPFIIKKHSEPFKQKLIKYFAYRKNQKQTYILEDELTKKDTVYWDESFSKVNEFIKSNLDKVETGIGKITLDATVEYDVEE